ncbi:MAG: hypothetical protein JSV43_04190 [Methanobacteriota archaeon]|nr:MAG: hypothetical protein JSV43_04190 [Euryarchaeota archaeon]
MKKYPLYILIVSVIIIVVFLGYALYLNLTEQQTEQSGLGLVCTVIFLVFAFIAIELMFKPQLFLRSREEMEEEAEQEDLEEPELGP